MVKPFIFTAFFCAGILLMSPSAIAIKIDDDQKETPPTNWCKNMPPLLFKQLAEALLNNDEYFTLSALTTSCPHSDGADTELQERIKDGLKKITVINSELDIIADQTGNPDHFNTFHRSMLKNLPLHILIKIKNQKLLVGALASGNRYWQLQQKAKAQDAGALETLDLSQKQETEMSLKLLPPEVENFKEVKALDLANNKLVVFPEVLTKLPRLERLSIASNKMLFVPAYIGQLKRLREIDLQGNKFASLPPAFGRLWDIKKITIDSKLYTNQAVQDQVQIVKSRRSTTPGARFSLEIIGRPLPSFTPFDAQKP